MIPGVMRMGRGLLGLALLLNWGVLVVAQIIPVTPTQKDHRWRNDDGGEATATWLAFLDAPITIDEIRVLRLRVGVHGLHLGGPFPPQSTTVNQGLEYSADGAVWTAVSNDASHDFYLALSDFFADGDPTTPQITPTPTVLPGRMTESAVSYSHTYIDDEYEFEWCFEIDPAAPNGTYRFRVSNVVTTSFDEAILHLQVPEAMLIDGSAFSPMVTPGQPDQILGRFELIGNVPGLSLEAATILLNGTRSGLSGFKLWGSSDSVFDPGLDTQLGSTIMSDPGMGMSLTYSSFSLGVDVAGVFVFLTADVESGALGQVLPVIQGAADLHIGGGRLEPGVNQAPLSAGTPVPVELLFFDVD